jgi:hypothetical protein
MTTYTIDQENNVTAYASAKEAKGQPQTECFSSAKELARLAGKGPANRLVDIWNSLPGQTPVKRFTSRKAAITRIWLAIQRLDASVGAPAPRVPSKKAEMAQKATRREKTPTARDGSKKAEILDLLRRKDGATLDNLMAATGWQAHSVRGFISGSLRKKMGLVVQSSKRETGERVYSIAN